MKGFLIFVGLLFVLTSCTKDKEFLPDVKELQAPVYEGKIELDFTNYIDTNLMALDTVNYILENGDKLKLTMYKYYVSNVRFMRADSTYFTEEYSYHLIDESSEASKKVVISNVPDGDYIKMEFMIGVDSAHNVSGSQVGELDPGKGMFWTWNTGYIMAKMEGTSPQSPTNMVGYHIGGFKGTNSALKTVSPSFNGVHAGVTATLHPKIKIKCNAAEWFKTPNAVSFATVYNVTTVGTNSKILADNYADMFSVTGIEY